MHINLNTEVKEEKYVINFNDTFIKNVYGYLNKIKL
jgi:hypothetical protein